MTLEAFLTVALAPCRHQRPGQKLMNELAGLKPELYSLLAGSAIDPFYVDSNLWAAVEWLCENWDELRAKPPAA